MTVGQGGAGGRENGTEAGGQSGGTVSPNSGGSGGSTIDASGGDTSISDALVDGRTMPPDAELADPGTTGDGRFPMARPPAPPEAAGRLPGVLPGMMQAIQIGSAMGFAGRGIQVYVPAAYVPGTPVAFTVCHDGTALNGSVRLTTVMDNLASQKKMPTMVVIFVPPVSRSPEYDTVDGKFTQYITTQVLPAVAAKGIKLTTDPEATGTCGHSSGGILAFTMAWFQPERYRRVLSLSGSFTRLQTPGGDLYDQLLRTTMPLKPIRTAMTAGTADLLPPRWTMANEGMSKALMESGYHHRYVLIAGGGHNQDSSLPLIPELLTWLWRGYPASGPTR